MSKKNRSNRSRGVILAVILATFALILAGYNTYSIIFQSPSGNGINTEKSTVRVYLNYTQSFASGSADLINFTSKSFDLYSDFDLLEDQFISPNDGYFRFHLDLEISSASTLVNLVMYKDGTLYSQAIYNNFYSTISFSDIVYLQLGGRVNFTLRFMGDPGSVIGSIGGDRTYLTIEEI